MAIAYSTEYQAQHVTIAGARQEAVTVFANIMDLPFNFLNPASGGLDAIGDLIYLVKVPEICDIVMHDCIFRFSAWTATATIDIGWLAYKTVADATVAADDNGLFSGLLLTAAGWWHAGVMHSSTDTTSHQAPVTEVYQVRAREQVTLTAVFRTAVPSASDTFSGRFRVRVP